MPDVTITNSIATESKCVTPIAMRCGGTRKGSVMKLETNGCTPIDHECRDGGSSIASAMVAWIAAMLLLIAEAVAILAVAMPARSSAAPQPATWCTGVTFEAPAPSYEV